MLPKLATAATGYSDFDTLKLYFKPLPFSFLVYFALAVDFLLI